MAGVCPIVSASKSGSRESARVAHSGPIDGAQMAGVAFDLGDNADQAVRGGHVHGVMSMSGLVAGVLAALLVCAGGCGPSYLDVGNQYLAGGNTAIAIE